MRPLRTLSTLLVLLFCTGCETTTTTNSYGRIRYASQSGEVRRGFSAEERANWNDIKPSDRIWLDCFIAFRGPSNQATESLIDIIAELEILSSAESMEMSRMYDRLIRLCEQSRSEYLNTLSKKVRPETYSQQHTIAMAGPVWSFMPQEARRRYNSVYDTKRQRLHEALRQQNAAAKILAKYGMRSVRVYSTDQGAFEIDLIRDNLGILAKPTNAAAGHQSS